MYFGAGQQVIDYLKFYLEAKIFISSFLNDIFNTMELWGDSIFLSALQKVLPLSSSLHSSWKVSCNSLPLFLSMKLPFKKICPSFVFSLFFGLQGFEYIMSMHKVFCLFGFGLILLGVLWVSWNYGVVYTSLIWKVLRHYFFKYLFCLFYFGSLSAISITCNLQCFIMFHSLLMIFANLFFLLVLQIGDCHWLFMLMILRFALLRLLMSPLKAVFICFTVSFLTISFHYSFYLCRNYSSLFIYIMYIYYIFY